LTIDLPPEWQLLARFRHRKAHVILVQAAKLAAGATTKVW